jgi:protein SCO1/2
MRKSPIRFLQFLIVLSFSTMNALSAAPPYGNFGKESTLDPALMLIDESKFLGSRLEPNYVFVNSEGKEFTLGDMIGKPLIILLSYYSCDGTCPALNKNLKQALSEVNKFQLGKEYRVMTVSFDKQDSAETLAHFVHMIDVSEDIQSGWQYAILKNKSDIDRLTASVGYKFFWSRTDQVFIHPNVLIFLTPEGRVARYIYGTAMDGKNLELALIDADWNRIANSTSVINMLAGVCYSYNFEEGKYTINYSLFIGVASLIFGISIVVFSIVYFRFKTNKNRSLPHAKN